MQSTIRLEIPNTRRYLVPGNKVKLGRFEATVWEVLYGWYAWGGNRPVCGWYLQEVCNPIRVKPLQLPDLDDIYFIET